MSFTTQIKNEINKIELIEPEAEKIAELSAIIYNSEYDDNFIRISIENSNVANRVFALLKDIFKVNSKVTVRRGYNYSNKYLYILEVNSNIKDILSILGIYKSTYLLKPEDYIIDDMESTRAYLRGLFSICGSINDPKKSRYHLEFLVNNEKYASFISKMLNEFYLNSKYIKRNQKYMIYIKEAEKIGDFLRIINANIAVMYYEDIRIYRDHKNMTNRLNNMEQANVDKMIASATKQVEDIELINEIGGLDLLDEKEKIVAEYRLKYKEASLSELSEIISYETGKKISKSGINHRMKKIKELSNRIRNKEKD